jgi:hypothetical protein
MPIVPAEVYGVHPELDTLGCTVYTCQARLSMRSDHVPPPSTPERTPLTRQRALDAAVELADRDGIDAVSMRNLASRLGVVPMALYKHVANKEDLLD